MNANLNKNVMDLKEGSESINLINLRKKYFLQMNLYINRRCSIKCPYCYVRADKNNWGQEYQLNNILKYIKLFDNLVKDKSLISFIGGEPTDHPDFLKIIESSKHTKHDIHLYTNGMNPEILEKMIKINKNIKITLTYHKVCDKNKFTESLNILEENNYTNYHLNMVFDYNNEIILSFMDNYPQRIKFLSFIHDYYEDSFENYKEEYLKFMTKHGNDFSYYDLSFTDNYPQRIKRCFYNEFNVDNPDKNKISISDCLVKNNKLLGVLNNDIYAGKITDFFKHLNLLEKTKGSKCDVNCPKDPAYIGSIEYG